MHIQDIKIFTGKSKGKDKGLQGSCFLCGEFGHPARECPKGKGKSGAEFKGKGKGKGSREVVSNAGSLDTPQENAPKEEGKGRVLGKASCLGRVMAKAGRVQAKEKGSITLILGPEPGGQKIRSRWEARGRKWIEEWRRWGEKKGGRQSQKGGGVLGGVCSE